MTRPYRPHTERYGDFEAAMDRYLKAYFDAEDMILENMKRAAEGDRRS